VISATKPRRRAAVLILTLIGSACFAAGCSSSSSGTSAQNSSNSDSSNGGSVLNLTVGFPDDLSGDNVAAGKEQEEVAQLAVQNINATDKNVHMTLVVKDTQSTASAAVSAIEQLISDHSVNAIVGMAFTSSALATSPLLTRSGLPTIYLQVTDMTGAGNNIVSLAAPGQAQLQLLVDDVLLKQNIKSAGFIWQQIPTFTSNLSFLRSYMTSKGIAVVASEGGSETQTDFGSEVSAVLAKNPGVIIVQALTPQTATIASNLRAAGYKGLIVGYQNIQETAFRAAAGTATNGVYYTTYWDPAAADASAKTMLAAWQAAYPDAGLPDVFGMQAWDGLHILAQAAMKIDSTDPAKLATAIRTGSWAAGAQPVLTFGSDQFAVLHGYVIQYTATGTRLVAS
jgi:branched-chain amino acid transport system substrate-binding protein